MGAPETDHKHRKRLRKRLLAKGVPMAEVQIAVDRMRRGQLARRRRDEAAEANRRAEVRRVQSQLDEQFADVQRRSIEQARAQQEQAEAEIYGVDDTKHKPSAPDPLKMGVARVTGVTAKAIGRKKALTRWEYDALEAKEASR